MDCDVHFFLRSITVATLRELTISRMGRGIVIIQMAHGSQQVGEGCVVGSCKRTQQLVTGNAVDVYCEKERRVKHDLPRDQMSLVLDEKLTVFIGSY